ncbi:Predicted signal-transduction protein containing cAMP-binding and CBS domains [hydrothermal vent metagenome]|uniref:Predicted signal-transduction protein containing cAMP-binding and CBS domains n=1 Tax=hydrothermal vent metagenome TaxID=652676 RepID=A0A3B1A9B8_9ZZZZ
MEIELLEIRDFIKHYSPFDVLDDSALDTLPKNLTIRYFRRGQVFPEANADEKNLYMVRSGAIEFRDRDAQLTDKLGEGDIYSQQCIADTNAPDISWQGVCVEDTLVYLLPCNVLAQLRKNVDVFNRHFNRSINERLREAVEYTHAENMRDLSAMKLEVSGLTDRLPVIVDEATSIQQAAKIMTNEQVSSILVSSNSQLIGLLTDRDIRSRCVAEGVALDNPIGLIMSTDLETVSDSTLLSEAVLAMTRKQIQHLPVLKNNKPIGILTTSDVVRHLSTSSALIATDIVKAHSLEALEKISTRLPELQLQLSLSSATAKHIGEVISSISDAITCRLLELAEAQYGAPPVSYVWAAGGSQARNEQTSHSDQDSALIISNNFKPEHGAYFKTLTEFVSNGLNACGYVFCPGNAMATNEQWRQPLVIWKKTFKGWINSPAPKALMLSSIFFDLRPVYGDFSLLDELQQAVLEQTKDNQLFISHMVANALKHQPPLGFFRNFVMVQDDKHKNTLNLKQRGIIPIVDIARVLALKMAISATNTVERLNAACDNKVLSVEMRDNLLDALEFIGSLRIRHQAEQIRTGVSVDNYVSPKELSGLEKSHLKDSFSIIKTMQQFFESRYPSV